MAKALPVRGLDPDRRLAPNARRILLTRIGEVWSYDVAVHDVARVRELHDMRIACKRLRYLLEIFGVGFRADLGPFVREVTQLQDVLGEIHDCDVQVPRLEEHLRWLDDREAAAAQGLVASRRRRRAAPPDPEAALAACQRRLSGTLRGDERPGIHALIARRRAERAQLYSLFLERWRRLKAERFRQQLEGALQEAA